MHIVVGEEKGLVVGSRLRDDYRHRNPLVGSGMKFVTERFVNNFPLGKQRTGA